MSQISATFVVEPYDITVQAPTANIEVQPQVIDLNIFSAGFSNPAGNNGELQYNNGGTLGGVNVAIFSGGNVVFTDVSNVKIPGGSNAYFLQTDGTGNVTWAPGTVNANTGNGIAVGANTQIQITDGTGNFVSAPGFTFDYIANSLTVPGAGFFTGNINSGNANLGNAAIANYFIGNGAFLTGIDTSQIVNGNSNVKVYANANVTISAIGNANVVQVSANDTQIYNALVIQQAKEKIGISGTGATGTIDFDVLDQAILFYTGNASNNFTVNFRGNSITTLDSIMSSNQSMTVRFINTNGNTGYYINNFQVDGANVTPLWPFATGNPVAGISNGKDIYDFEIIKTASNTYTIFAVQTGYQ
jgi:hypothetical protein